ncbi:endonuclease/exonuclease/phosphatase family protein [Riemerella columbina]|uniref:endonuclease/exonuclease/phosphatase family protein n=1 Tax=Riemerella columbina TaxID=103810 RepID=UPI000379A2A6|nr:endonuclease/exonuclease/phosphatase family protein [Riemerella columbina]
MTYIAFYNTENFFPPESPFLPASWDNKKYLHKRQNLVKVFELMKHQYGSLPALIGLAEIGNKKVVKELLDFPIFEKNYGYIHYESPDERGIDVALTYDKTRIHILHSEPIRYEFEMNNGREFYMDTTRDVLYVQLEILGQKLHYFLVHLPSKRDKDINLDKRNHILSSIKEKIESIILNQKEAVIVAGDFNENPNEANLQEFRYHEGISEILENPFLKHFYQHHYSTFHHKQGLLFDQIMCSQHFFNAQFPLQYKTSVVFARKELSRKDDLKLLRPNRTYSGTRYIGGYSDHFPVLLCFDESKNQA